MYTPHHSVLYLLPPGSLFVAVSFTFWFILALELLYSNSNAISIISLDLVLGSFELWARARWMEMDRIEMDRTEGCLHGMISFYNRQIQ